MSREVYNDPRWQEMRRLVLTRDAGVCQIRRAKCKVRATEVDHIVAVSDGGDPFNPSNLRAACKSCNIAVRNERVARLAREARTGERIEGVAEQPVHRWRLPWWSRDWDDAGPSGIGSAE